MKILITGSSGYIGSVFKMPRKGHNVRAVDRFFLRQPSRTQKFRKNKEIVEI